MPQDIFSLNSATPQIVLDEVSRQVAALSLPQPASSTPPATALDGARGSSGLYARQDHTHAARVQRTTMLTDANGLATFTFARPIVVLAGSVPPITYMVEDVGTPVVVQITGRTFVNDPVAGTDMHTAVAVKAQRSRTLPATLLSLNALLNFDLFAGVAASVRVNLFAADPTQ